jgi:tRNA dimethylallyltransferase
MKKEANRVVVICGPTASGKTDFAHKFALKNNGQIVNADSMQIYKELPIITASPEDHLRAELPYHLYNFQNVDQEFSAAKYARSASEVVKSINENDSLPVIVGGSGMYINMLVNGYNVMPDIEDEVRNQARELYKGIGAEAFFTELKKIDPEVVKRLNVGDRQRVTRAYEVFKQTGRSILDFQAKENEKLLENFECKILFLLPERKFLHFMCNERLKKMFVHGAIEEVENMYKQYGEIQTSAAKALGVSEIIAYIKGEISLEQALELASARTRQYAKRQITWFMHQLQNKEILRFSDMEEYGKLMEMVNNN